MPSHQESRPNEEGGSTRGDRRETELREWLAFRGATSERDALSQLFEDHRTALITFVFRRTGDAALTEDVVAETFLAAARARANLEWRGVPLRGWLLRIATNELRAQQRSRRDGEPLDELAAPDREPEVDVEALRRALATLPEEWQEAVTLHHLDATPVHEVARLLGAPEGTIKSWLSRARAALRGRLQLDGEEPMP
ncbi:MAG: RNA polymerase sigma factor [Planctomycetes bacterium]|nr:RNA polymerase sigma factor [Planctomycetota bacterium]